MSISVTSRRAGLASMVGLLTALALVAPALADTHTIYMTTPEDCKYSECGIIVMQVKGQRVRYKAAYAMSGGVGSIGWMTRRGGTITGLTGGECQKGRTSMAVVGKGERTHFPHMKVRSKAQAQAFVSRHPDATGLGIPTWPWVSLSEWKANYARIC